MVDSTIAEEFIGRFYISYKEGKNIYAYDEITHGVYKFELSLREVNLVISSDEICQETADAIKGISKIGNEIILVPFCLDSKWIFYNMKEGVVRYESLIKEKICISEVITIDKTLFLIPLDIYNPITIISLDNLRKINIQNDWINRDKLKNGTDGIWGASYYGHTIVFPIVNSKQIIYVNNKKTNVINVDIPQPILSVCVHEDKIWILPISGGYIYMVNFSGDILEKVDLSKGGQEISTCDFIRVIAAGENVFLLPKYGGYIYVYQIKKDRVVQIKKEEAYLPGELFLPSSVSYWDFAIENGELHLLPSNVRYRTISLSSLKSCEYVLCYGENINHDSYWKMVVNAQKRCVFIEDKNREIKLNSFLEYVYYTFEEYSTEDSMKNGKRIWNSMK